MSPNINIFYIKKKRKTKEDFKIKYKQADMFRITSICLTILFLGLLSSSITHAESYKFVTKWGSDGNGAGQLYHPSSIVATPSGYVYVADTDNHRVQEFNSNGKFINQWSAPPFGYPPSAAVDSSGNVYVVGGRGNCIVKYDKDGNIIAQWGSEGSDNGQFKGPWGIAIDSSSNVYVVDKGNNRIEKFDSNGNYLMQWGKKGISNGQFWDPHGAAVDLQGNVYVADTGNTCIKKFDSNGNYLTQLGSSGKDNGQFNNVMGVAVDSSGNIYVADTNNNRIQKFDSEGNYITQWGSYGTNDGQFENPMDVAVDSSGYVYVADNGNNRIQKFAPVNPPVTNFTSNVTTGSSPLTVKFNDTSTGTPFSWVWNFGDGANSTVQNPTHTYSKVGSYTVTLTATNSVGSNTTTKTNYITVTPAGPKPVANFTSNVKSGNVPLKVTFTDKSTGSPTSWKWSFGDGTYSTVKNPVYTYNQAGNYTVSLTVKNAAGSSTKTIKNYIGVNASKAPVAAFSASPTTGKAPLTVTFTDKSTNNPSSWAWNFGDNNTSTAQNPVHKYTAAGNYTVSLTAKNAKGSNTKTMPGYIKVSKK